MLDDADISDQRSDEAMNSGSSTPPMQPWLGEDAAWRQEVASRVDAFCARRGRKRTMQPPSLRLDFERTTRATAVSQPTPDPWEQVDRNPMGGETSVAVAEPVPEPEPEPSNVIPFPAPAEPEPIPTSFDLPFIEELAEPIVDTPRILEAEEPVEGTLQIGGQAMPSITLEKPAEEPIPEPAFPEPALVSNRAFAGLLDLAVVGCGAGVFAAVFFKIAGAPPLSRMLLACAAIIAGILWAIYEYGFLVYGGSTIGMKVAGLALRAFDGGAVPQRSRRWRAIAMMISGVSLGMGFAWAILDEDGLCWHDRISRSLLLPR
jgi:uncharacterized RDD family membrane protein YckC